MIKRRRFPRIFPGWWIVIGGGIITLWGNGYYTGGISPLFKPISSELGLSRAATSVAASIGRFEGGFEAPLTGWLTDRYGPRWIVLLGVFLIGLALILMNFVNSPWTFYIAWGVILGTGVNIGTSVSLDTSIANWFVKKRGLALSIKWIFAGSGGVLMVPLIAWLIVIQGWRMAVLIGGIVMLAAGLPLAWFCLKQRRPEYYGSLPDGATPGEEATEAGQVIDRGVKYAAEVQEVEFTLRQAIRTPTYWLLLVAQNGQSLVLPAITIHGIPFLTDIGIDPLMAAFMLAIPLLVSLPVRLASGFLADRVKKRTLTLMLGGGYLLQAAGFAVFLLHQTIPMIYVWFVLWGFGLGISAPLNPTVRARYFGRKAFGSISGVTQMLLMPVGIAAPIYLGWVYDTTGSYIDAFVLLTALAALAGTIMCLIPPPKPPARVTDIHEIV